MVRYKDMTKPGPAHATPDGLNKAVCAINMLTMLRESERERDGQISEKERERESDGRFQRLLSSLHNQRKCCSSVPLSKVASTITITMKRHIHMMQLRRLSRGEGSE